MADFRDEWPPRHWPKVWWVTNPRKGNSPTPAEQDMLIAVHRGFLTGELEPLRDYLAAGYPLDAPLRREIIAAIDGRGGGGRYKLKLWKPGRRGEGTLISERRKAKRDYDIWDFVHRREKETNLKTAIDDAKIEFGLQRAAIMKARSDCEQRLSGAKSKQNAK